MRHAHRFRWAALGAGLVTTLLAPLSRASFPGTNGVIAFTAEGDDGEEIRIMNPDGSDVRGISNDPVIDVQAKWSADGTRIVFRRGDADPEREIWVMNADGSGQTQLTFNETEDEQASWSPDGTKIVYADDRDGNKQIYVMNADGTNQVRLIDDLSASYREPVFSPDGTRIAYRRQPGGGETREIWVMNADGTNRIQLTDNDAEDEDPDWSPDGTKIVFESDRDGGKEIYVMNADGSNPTRLTFEGTDEENDPDWSPDGTRIVFKSGRDGYDAIYVMNADGSDPIRLTEPGPDVGEPSWQSIPFGVTTTTTSTSTSTTTLPGDGGILVSGKRLLLKDKAGKPQKRALKLIAKDPAIGAGAENGGPGDPTIHGGFLRVVSASGDGFGDTYDLPVANWRTKGKPGKNKGYKLKKAGPIKTVLVKPGKSVKVVAKGAELGHTLGADPNPVHVALGLGSQVYCLTFGGQTEFKAGKSFSAKKARAPGACSALVPMCGDGVLDMGESCPLLEGVADDPAIDATANYDGEAGVPIEEVDAETGVVRTRVELEFSETATVGQVNAVLTQLGGDIVMMLANVPLLEVRIPDPGSLAALDALIASANGDPAVRVGRGYLTDDDVLPGNFSPPGSSDLGKIDHHLAVGAAAAWNAKAAIRSVPLVVIGDAFGDGAPNADAGVLLLDSSEFGNLLALNSEHGYHVLGIIAGRFGGSGACAPGASGGAVLRGCVTGMFPAAAPHRIPLRVADSGSILTALGFRMAIVLRATTSGKVVTNTSRNECFSGMCGDPAVAGNRARQWALMVRGAGLETSMLHLTSAGNIKSATPGVTDAQTNSSFSAAALLPTIPDFFGTGTIANLTNTLVIENVVNGAPQEFTPRCLTSSSKRGGQLSGIGQAVWSLIDPSSGADDKTGTSMATPQVAGLATYLWAIDPNMTVTQIRTLLVDTARPVTVSSSASPCDASSTQPAPIIDAYAAVLALDQAALPTPATAPVRRAILDTNDDGTFDGTDLVAFVLALIDPTTDALQEPTEPEWERFDLNGDGYTGGAQRTRPFDLDRVGSTQYGASQLDDVTQTIEGASVIFDETALTDLAILCYYAHSALYQGDTMLRDQMLDVQRCSGLEMSVIFASEITPGSSETLTVSIGRPGPSGSEPVENVYVELSPSGGTATPMSGMTNAQGDLSSQIALDMGSTFVEVIVQALTGPGGTVLAEEVVSAAAPCTDSPSMVQLDFGTGEPDPTVDGPVLQNGADYRITVSGTYSIWTGEWQSGECKGTAGGGVGGPTGLDAHYWFAIPNGSVLCGGGFTCCPNDTDKFRMSLDGGSDFFHPDAVNEQYDASHIYEHIVRGEGQQVVFMIEESSARGDDYGILDIRIECANGSPGTTTTSTSSTTITTTTTSSTSSTIMIGTTTTSTATSTSTTSTLFAAPVVPYARYDATGPDGPTVMLDDQYASELADLGTVILQLPPVAIDGLLPPDPDTSQTCYGHPGGVLDECVDVEDRFGLKPLRVGNPVGVCVPELFPAITVDAFKCYQANGTALDLAVGLEDEFQVQAVTVGKPELFCTPVEVDGDPIADAGRYLVCYATTPPGMAGGQLPIENALHGAPIQVDVGVATGLCVPAIAQTVSTCALCGNGVTDPNEECDDANTVDGDGCSAVCVIEP